MTLSFKAETFSTDDRYLAAWLLAKNVMLLRTEREGRFVTFYFHKDEGLEVLQHAFWNNEVIAVRDYMNALETVWSLIRQHNQSKGEEHAVD